MTYDDVSFSYGGDMRALDAHLDRHRARQMAAFVGASGAGKTTLTYLLPRLYDAGEGHIRAELAASEPRHVFGALFGRRKPPDDDGSD